MVINPEKNLVAWNNENIDTYHDIVVSFDYSRYAINSEPTGGFCVVFFESRLDIPQLGGPGRCLGYLPSSQKDYCYQQGYEGFSGAYLGVGFDSLGEFALPTDIVDGTTKNVANSCSIRSSESEKYKFLATSSNMFFTPKEFLIAENLKDTSSIKKRTVRIIINKAFTNIEVQIKNTEEESFYTVLTTKIPIRKRTAIRVGITSTFLNDDTKFNLYNFNVAGFPGIIPEEEMTDCLQTFKVLNKIPGETIVSGKDFCAVPVGNSIYVYRLTDNNFKLTQTITEDSDNIKLLGGNDNFLFVGEDNTYNVNVYYKISRNFLRTQTINLISELGSEGDNSINYPTCADTDNKTMVIGNNQNVYVFNYIAGAGLFGRFNYLQSINRTLSGDIGFSVQVDGTSILTGGGKPRFDGETVFSLENKNILKGRYDSFVGYYEFNGREWPGRGAPGEQSNQPTQVIVSPITGNRYNEFGKSIQIQGSEAVISAPNEFRRKINDPGQGEVYHYFFARRRVDSKTGSTSRFGREWRSVMELGSFYSINSPAGNFGTSISFLGNNLIVSAPYEAYKTLPDLSFEDKFNVGRIYVFRKTLGGTFSQTTVITPNFLRSEANMEFGRYVGLVGSKSVVGAVPYRLKNLNGEIDFYKIGCLFDISPEHIPVNEETIGLYDNAGFNVVMNSYDYMQLLNYDTSSFLLFSDVIQVFRGGSFTVSLKTKNVADGTLIPYRVTGIIQPDLIKGLVNGDFIIKDNSSSAFFELSRNIPLTTNLITINLADESIEPLNLILEETA
jgi:hypothetical protein